MINILKQQLKSEGRGIFMKKKLLCIFTCMSMLLVACSGKKEADSKKEESKSYSEYVELGDYKGMELTKELGQVEDADLQNKIDEILQTSATVEKIKEGTVADGDTVNIDYIGKVDGVAFDNGTAQGQSLTIGSNSYIEGFESGLIGAKVGDTVTVNVTFPEEYGVDELNGQDATFDVTINYIEGETIIPEWNDAFVKSVSEYNTTKEYENELMLQLEQELAETEEYTLQANILTNLMDVCSFNGMPEDEVTEYADSMKQYYQEYASQNNMEYADFLTNYFSMTEEDFNAQIQQTAENAIKQKMAVYAIAEAEDLIPEGTEREEKELAIAQNYGASTLEEFAATYGDDYALQLVIRDEVIKFIEENAVITEVQVPSSSETPVTAEAE